MKRENLLFLWFLGEAQTLKNNNEFFSYFELLAENWMHMKQPQ